MKRKNFLPLLLLPILFLLPTAVFAQEDSADGSGKKGLEISGKTFDTISVNHSIDTATGTNTFTYAGISTLRINAMNADHSQVKFETSFDINLFAGEYADLYRAYTGSGIPALLDQNTAITFTLRKLYLSLFTDFVDITLGRQIINYGVGYLFSPIDVFSKVDYTDINFTRKGSDILRVKFPLGDTSGLDIESTLTTHWTDLTAAAKLYTNLFGFDLAAIGIYNGETKGTTAGLTIKGDLELGVHGELVGHWLNDWSDFYFEAMTGVDYSFFDKNLIVMLEYYYNDRPIDPATVTPATVASIDRTFYNRHYVFFQMQYLFDEIHSAAFNIIYNPLDNAAICTLLYNWNLFQNANLIFYTRYLMNNINGISLVAQPDLQYSIRLEVLF